MVRGMTFFLKCIFSLLILIGIPITVYGIYQVMGTMSLVRDTPERIKATFVGYDREVIETTSTSPSASSPGQYDHQKSETIMSYPCFEYRARDGSVRRVRESKAHVVEHLNRGQQVEIILPGSQIPRLADFYSLYGRDLLILILGLGFILIPLIIWKVAISSLETPPGIEVTRFWKEAFDRILSISVGPFSFAFILKVFAGLMILVLSISLISAAVPLIKQLRLGSGWGLMEAIEKKNFDVARELIIKRKGIHKVNEYNENSLLLALEAALPELARLLVEAGADVNIKSRMYQTPLRVATQSGDLEMVRSLISRGASLDAPEDEFPPVIYVLTKGYDVIARVLIEA